MEDYLNAKSMVTPGVAGGLVMLISNTCASQFNLAPRWTALVLSGLLGLLVVCILTAPLWQKGLLWVFNALIIFSMAMGTNHAAVTLQEEPPSKHTGPIYSTPSPEPFASPVVRSSLSPRPSPAATAPAHAVLQQMIIKDKFFKPW
jgi:hypothetical protein